MESISCTDLDERYRDSVEEIINEFGLYEEGNAGAEDSWIVSIFSIGSHKNEGDNEASDVDLTVVVRDHVYRVKDRRERMEKFLREKYSEKIKFWLASEDMYLKPEKRMVLEPVVRHDIDGPDDLARLIGFYINTESAYHVAGKPVEEMLAGSLPKADPLAGYEFIQIVSRDFARGILGRTKRQIVEKLAGKSSGKGTEPQELIEAYSRAFDGYMNKREEKKADSHLSDLEREVQTEVITKDNDMAKASLRAIYGLHVLLGGEFLGGRRKDGRSYLWSDIRQAGFGLIQRRKLSGERKEVEEFLKEIFEIKLNKTLGGKGRWINWSWDFEGEMPILNREEIERYCGFFRQIREISEKKAFERGYFFDLKRVSFLKKHLMRNTPGLIKLISTDENATPEMLKLYSNAILEVAENEAENYELGLEILNNEDLLQTLICSKDYRDSLLAGRIYSALARKGAQSDSLNYALFAYGNISEAIEMLEEFLNQGSHTAVDVLKAQIDLSQAYAELAYVRAECQIEEELPREEVERMIEKAQRLNPFNPRAWILAGEYEIAEFLNSSSGSNLNRIPEVKQQRFAELWSDFLKRIVTMEREVVERSLKESEDERNVLRLKNKLALQEIVNEELDNIQSLKDVYAIYHARNLEPCRYGIDSTALEEKVRKKWSDFSRKQIKSLLQLEKESKRKRLGKRKVDPVILYVEGEKLEKQGKYIEAAVKYLQARELNSSYSQAQDRLNRIMNLIERQFDISEQYPYLPELHREEIISFARKMDSVSRDREHSSALLSALDIFFKKLEFDGRDMDLVSRVLDEVKSSFTSNFTLSQQISNLEEAQNLLEIINKYSEVPEDCLKCREFLMGGKRN